LFHKPPQFRIERLFDTVTTPNKNKEQFKTQNCFSNRIGKMKAAIMLMEETANTQQITVDNTKNNLVIHRLLDTGEFEYLEWCQCGIWVSTQPQEENMALMLGWVLTMRQNKKYYVLIVAACTDASQYVLGTVSARKKLEAARYCSLNPVTTWSRHVGPDSPPILSHIKQDPVLCVGSALLSINPTGYVLPNLIICFAF
jgi:hypothetical protein